MILGNDTSLLTQAAIAPLTGDVDALLANLQALYNQTLGDTTQLAVHSGSPASQVHGGVFTEYGSNVKYLDSGLDVAGSNTLQTNVNGVTYYVPADKLKDGPPKPPIITFNPPDKITGPDHGEPPLTNITGSYRFFKVDAVGSAPLVYTWQLLENDTWVDVTVSAFYPFTINPGTTRRAFIRLGVSWEPEASPIDGLGAYIRNFDPISNTPKSISVERPNVGNNHRAMYLRCKVSNAAGVAYTVQAAGMSDTLDDGNIATTPDAATYAVS